MPKVNEVWLLEFKDNPGMYVCAIDGACDVYMAIFNRKDAEREAKRQNRMHDLNCHAVGFKLEPIKKGGA